MRVNIVSYISRQFETRQLDCTLFYSTDESKLAQKDFPLQEIRCYRWIATSMEW